jgi:hypothetical protein
MAAMRKEKLAVGTSTKQASRESKLQQDLIDERVIAEAHDDSAWEAPIDVKRDRRSAGLSVSLARRARQLVTARSPRSE